MAKVFVTGSADGLGQMAAQLLVEQGHEVVLHARSEGRGAEALRGVPGAAGLVAGDLRSLAGMRSAADKANAFGRFDAVIHNAAVGYKEPRRVETEDGLPEVFAVNTLAPYVLTALMERPARLVYLSSELHQRGNKTLKDLSWRERAWNGTQAYCDSKLHDTLLAFAVARRWPEVLSNSVEPGWVATKMGGPRATGDLAQGHLTQVWLAVGEDAGANVSGRHFYHKAERPAKAVAGDVAVQERLLEACAGLSGVRLE